MATAKGVIHYEYDAVTGLHTETWTASDTLTTEANSTTHTIYDYDALGRLTAVTQDRRNGAAITAETTDYVFDLLGNLKQERLSNGVVSDYTYLCPCQLADVGLGDLADFRGVDTVFGLFCSLFSGLFCGLFCGTTEERLAWDAGGGNESPCPTARGGRKS